MTLQFTHEIQKASSWYVELNDYVLRRKLLFLFFFSLHILRSWISGIQKTSGWLLTSHGEHTFPVTGQEYQLMVISS